MGSDVRLMRNGGGGGGVPRSSKLPTCSSVETSHEGSLDSPGRVGFCANRPEWLLMMLDTLDGDEGAQLALLL